ncbi:MAG: rhodanese-like domain-containing protein [Flavobacteriaceae bacterium]|nr:rhodanese-like domain-containing protein [Flavobacteriaceae bacterium]
MSKRYKTKKFIVKREYQILAFILVFIAAGLVMLPKYKKNEGIMPELFVKNAISSERFISTDQLADKLVNQDPSVLLIDVRSEKEFNEFSLPNTINIPLKNLLDDDYIGYIDQDIYDVVLFSNDSFYADQAWMLGNRLGFKNLYVLKGGLNEWFNTIINPKYPEETMPREAFKLYDFRKAAGMYFGVGAPKTEKKARTTKKVITVKKKKKRVAEGGC